MKKALLNGLVLLLLLAGFSNCKKNSDDFEEITIAKSITVAQMRALPVGLSKAKKIKKTGKIYIYNDYLFINEPYKGIHIYRNSNPSTPVNLAFLQVPGNVDIAIKDNILYADSYIDLLAFDISNPANAKQVKRVKDVFTQFQFLGFGNQNYVTCYKDTLVNKANYNKNMVYNDASSAAYSSSTGQGGSMARFTLLSGYLYTVSNSALNLFDVNTATDPSFVKAINLGWGVETIFPYENNLFIGTNTGMHIFSASNPANPVKLSTYSHAFACDPVVVQGKYAYVTLRTGTTCARGSNQLEVVNIEDLTKPTQVAVFPMQNPHGLSVSNNTLFLCEGDFGLKSFNIADKLKISDNLLQHLKTVKSFDVIAGPKSLIVTGEEGVYQFNYSNPSNLSQLSLIRLNTNSLY
ncbi:LVIVD repeat-containing protein [Pedobacter sp. MW01-1-1]|uniref:LVIVD repeat-containing protein n=1 Tax=Pedobacter sp. MW01-1-1 TaxID=3383027 RepID=UPI003FEF7E35